MVNMGVLNVNHGISIYDRGRARTKGREALIGRQRMGIDGTRRTKEESEICPVCHGSKGVGGIFGCKCVDNSRLLAGENEKRKKGGG